MMIWRIVIIAGVFLVFFGSFDAVTVAEPNEEVNVDYTWSNVDNNHVYYVRMSCASGKLVNMDYVAGAGTMTVAILTEDGLNEIINSGYPSSSEVLLNRESQSSGNIQWTPPQTQKYVLVFYDFSQTGTEVSVAGTFTGASNSEVLTSIGVAAVGAIVVIVGALRQRQLRKEWNATKPQEIVMYPMSSDAASTAPQGTSWTGVRLTCRTQRGGELIFKQPVCEIDGERKVLKWGEEAGIPLSPCIPHKVAVSFGYLGGKKGLASMEIVLNPGEIQAYEYRTPILMTRPGKLSRLH
jgi:hypothetical protein